MHYKSQLLPPGCSPPSLPKKPSAASASSRAALGSERQLGRPTHHISGSQWPYWIPWPWPGSRLPHPGADSVKAHGPKACLLTGVHTCQHPASGPFSVVSTTWGAGKSRSSEVVAGAPGCGVSMPRWASRRSVRGPGASGDSGGLCVCTGENGEDPSSHLGGRGGAKYENYSF